MRKAHEAKIILALLLTLFASTSMNIQAQNGMGAKKARQILYQPIDEQAVKRVEPYYDYRHFNIKDDVVVRVIVDEKGDVISAKAVSGHALLKGFAVRAAKDWKFAPKLNKGKPVKNRGSITIHFPPDGNDSRTGREETA
jgi:TonB family protein